MKENNITNLKKTINVFHAYGIPLTGKNKKASFSKELGMDRVFVDGLIYELELELQKQLEDGKIPSMESPQDVIQELFAVAK